MIPCILLKIFSLEQCPCTRTENPDLRVDFYFGFPMRLLKVLVEGLLSIGNRGSVRHILKNPSKAFERFSEKSPEIFLCLKRGFYNYTSYFLFTIKDHVSRQQPEFALCPEAPFFFFF